MLLQVSEMSAKLEELEDELTSAMDEEHAVSRLEVKGACIEITTHTATLIAITKTTLSGMYLLTHYTHISYLRLYASGNNGDTDANDDRPPVTM